MVAFICITVVGVFIAYGLGGAPSVQDEAHQAAESDTDTELE